MEGRHGPATILLATSNSDCKSSLALSFAQIGTGPATADAEGCRALRHAGQTSAVAFAAIVHRLSTLRPTMPRKTAGALAAQAKTNGYTRGAHREQDGIREISRHQPKTKNDQDGALDRYVA